MITLGFYYSFRVITASLPNIATVGRSVASNFSLCLDYNNLLSDRSTQAGDRDILNSKTGRAIFRNVTLSPKANTSLSLNDISIFKPVTIVWESDSIVSETTHIFPETDRVFPEVDSVLPDSDSVLPAVVRNVPEHVPVLPETYRNVPEHVMHPYKVVTYVPEQVRVLPETVQYVPEHVTILPEVVPHVPEHVRIIPGSGRNVPEHVRLLPEAVRIHSIRGHVVLYKANKSCMLVFAYSGVDRIFARSNSFHSLKNSLVSAGKSIISAFTTVISSINTFIRIFSNKHLALGCVLSPLSGISSSEASFSFNIAFIFNYLKSFSHEKENE